LLLDYSAESPKLGVKRVNFLKSYIKLHYSDKIGVFGAGEWHKQDFEV